MIKTHIGLFNPCFAIGIIVSLAACQKVDDQSELQSPTERDQPKITQESGSRELTMNFNQQLSFSKQDLANRLDVNVDDIKINVARQITWRSGALGCPKPGMSYTQALVPGVLILLDINGETYGYHAQQNQKPFHCPSRQAVIPDSIQKEDLV